MICSRNQNRTPNFLSLLGLAIFFSLSLHLGGCSEEETHASRTNTGDAEENVVTQDYFSAKLTDDTEFTYYFNVKDDFGEDCKIDFSDQNNDLTCIIDVNEGDLYFYSMKLQVNVPAGMCHFLDVDNYFHYNFDTGVGPSWFGIKKIYNADDELTGIECTQDQTLATWGECDSTNTTIEAWASMDGSVACRYNHATWVDSDYPNCCMGTGTIYTLNQGGSNNGDATTTQQVWGDSWEGCFGGPAAHPSWPKTDWGWPVRIRYGSWDEGKNMNVEITRNIATPNSHMSVHSANYYDDAPSTTNLPHAISPGTDRGGTVLSNTQDAYEFRCLDKAAEVINRIRVYIRDWNTYSEWLTYGSSLGVNGDPDVKSRGISDADRGSESAGDCHENYGIVGPCNDSFDWDDVNDYDSDNGSTGFFPMQIDGNQFYEGNWPEYESDLELDY